ncbi:hypothetical protein [Methylobacterium oryzisoli]|uniref:hypothetical protein n=1 Tax=Methylobacterium oryzisoli TaxID=3385502 RepID=UPI003891EFBE
MADQSFTAFWLGYAPSGPGAGPLLGAAPPYVDTVTLAFANLFPGNVTCQNFLFKANSEDAIRAGIAALRRSSPNLKILLSLIGTPDPIGVGWNTGITDPDAFAGWCAYLAHGWGLDGFDIDNEDLDSNPGQPFVDTVTAMRKAMPNAVLTLDTYLFARDQAVIRQLAPVLTGINTMAYFLDFDAMTALVEQYASVIEPAKIAIGVKADKVGPITQGTSVADTARLSAWNPSGGPKRGMMLWNLSQDIESVTGEPDGTWTRTIHDTLP